MIGGAIGEYAIAEMPIPASVTRVLSVVLVASDQAVFTLSASDRAVWNMQASDRQVFDLEADDQ